ncbi:Sister chromatid cohesion protein pds5-like protein, partial [Thalictrum thalictroides]
AETIEVILCGSLFPIECTIKDKVKHWVTLFTGFDKVEAKALEKILEQKQRLQQEMQKYLSLRQMHQDGELQKKIFISFRIMSRAFSDPVKAEENFQVLDQLKDVNVWKILTKVLDPNTSFHQAWTFREDLLKILGKRHPLYDFLGMLSMRCSYLLVDKECVTEILAGITKQKFAGETHFVRTCMNILVILARFSPTLLSGTVGDLVNFIKEDDVLLKEGALQILARAGGTLREQLAAVSSSVDLTLERLCLEGSRKQAKYAVHALAAITKDDGLKSLSVLYKRLVDMLVEKSHLPAILQSLGCIAQIAMPIFETRESEIVGFITNSILEHSNKAEDSNKAGWDERSELCLLKVFGVKTLVKSYLPVKDAHLRLGIESFLASIKNLLSIGEVSAHVESSPVDKAYMKLASAKAVLRLSKSWDHKIPIDVYHLTLKISEDLYPEAKKEFLGKVHQYVKDKVVDVKYACVFIHAINGAQASEVEEYKQYLVDVLQMCFQAKERQHPMIFDANPLMIYPEYILPFLVHSFAHHSSCPNVGKCTDVGSFERIYRQLHLFLSLLLHGNEYGKPEVNANKEKEIISAVSSIFQSIKYSEDIVDVTKSKNSHAVSDLGISITKALSQNHDNLIGMTTSAPLPLTLYKPRDKKEEDVSLTWLARDSVLAHFESFNLELDGTVADKNMEDNDEDENDVPLGQMMRKFISQRSKAKNFTKKVLLAETNNIEKDFDILGMVREINLDRLEKSMNSESVNGHEDIRTRETDKKNVQKVLISKKRKRQKTDVAISLASSKEKRSSSIQDIHKASCSRSSLKGVIKASERHSHKKKSPSYQSNEKEEENHVESVDKISIEDMQLLEIDVLASHQTIKKDKDAGCDLSDTTNVIGEIGGPEQEIPNAQRRASGNSSTSKSSTKSSKKRKRSMGGLTKCSSKEGEKTSLVGSRINVWWPLDKKFYEGLVQSYDLETDKHEILYNDGDLEVLHLDKECWELIHNGQTPKKLLNSLKVSPTKGMSSGNKKNNRTPSSLRQKKISNKKSSCSKVRPKGAPEKSREENQSDDLEDNMNTDCNKVESEAASDVSNSESAAVLKVDAAYSGDSKEQQIKESEKMLTDTEDEQKSDSEGKQVKIANLGLKYSLEVDKDQCDLEAHELHEEKSQAGGEESDSEEKSDYDVQGANDSDKSLEKQAKVSEKNITDLKHPDHGISDSDESTDSEDSDDEPLCVWKLKAGKGGVI